MNKPRNLLFIILGIALLLMSWNISSQDILGDEATYSFRSIGYIDYLGSSFQTQPIDWYIDEPLPFWTKLSFHDHPPLGFLIPHLFFRFFGDSPLVAKLPSILAGLGSIILLYFISLRIFQEVRPPNIEKKYYNKRFNIERSDFQKLKDINLRKFALLVAFLASSNGVFIAIFRTSLLEPLLIFFILLNICYFFEFLDNKKYWWVFGLTFGFVILTKYTGIFLLPVYFFYLIFRKWDFRNWRIYASLLVALLIFSPVLIYNFYLYQATRHFDLQFAYLLGQDTPEWSGLLGKIQAPFSDIGKNLTAFYGWPFLIMSLIGASYLFYETYRVYRSGQVKFQDRKSDYLPDRAKKEINSFLFLLLYLTFTTLLFVKIGAANRFLSLYLPAFIILVALALDSLWSFKAGAGRGYMLKAIVIAFIIFEIFFSINKNFYQVEDYGIAALDQYFSEEFKGRESAVIPQSDNKNLNEVIQRFSAKKKTGTNQDFMLIVYNDNVALGTLEWIFYRRFFYQSIPTLYVENFLRVLEAQGESYFKGFDIYFVQSTENTELNPFKVDKVAGRIFEENLIARGFSPTEIIRGKNGIEMFRVYKFSL